MSASSRLRKPLTLASSGRNVFPGSATAVDRQQPLPDVELKVSFWPFEVLRRADMFQNHKISFEAFHPGRMGDVLKALSGAGLRVPAFTAEEGASG